MANLKTGVARKQSTPNFLKSKHFLSTDPTFLIARTCAYQGLRNVFFFQKIWCALFSCRIRFEFRPFALLPTNFDVNWSNYLCENYLLR